MNEYLLASPADQDLADDVQPLGGTMENTSESTTLVVPRTPDAAAARSWDVGGVTIRKRRWYDKLEPPQRILLDAPCGPSVDVGDRRRRPPERPATPVADGQAPVGHAPAPAPAAPAPPPTTPVAQPVAVAQAAPAVDVVPVVERPAAAALVAPAVAATAVVDYVAPSPTTNGSSNGVANSNGAASSNGTALAPVALAEPDDSSVLRRLDGSSRNVATAEASVTTLVEDTQESESGPPSMGLSESARYHNAEFEISEVETHDPVLSRTVIEWIAVVAGALIVALVIKAALFQAFYIPSPSMVPTLVEDDRVLVNKLSYKLHDIRAGDVVVFERPLSERGGDDSDLIKRVIGLPGDRIKAEGGSLFVDGAALDEYYLDDVVTSDFPEIEVGPGQIFVMGDNRGNSKDSRVYGPVEQDLVVGRAFVKVWPISRLGLL